MTEVSQRVGPAAGPVPASTLPAGEGGVELERVLRTLVETKAWDLSRPLPTTREIGQRFGISNATVCRLLIRLSAEGLIWRRSNGRYFLNESRRVFENEPYACLLRRLKNWSRVYQGVMGGFSQAFARDRASMLFVHNDTLVRHADTAHPPVHADAAEQRAALAEFCRGYEGRYRGVLLDEVWRDDVLREFLSQLGAAVITCRPTTVAGLSSVSADFGVGALLAVGHLFARGYEEIWLAVPFANSATVDVQTRETLAAAAMLGKPIAARNVVSVATPVERERFVARLVATRARVGVFCLEDNMSVLLREALQQAGLACPVRVGLLSGMGTDLVTERRISTLRIDYEKIGETAGEILASGKVRTVRIAPELVVGGSS